MAAKEHVLHARRPQTVCVECNERLSGLLFECKDAIGRFTDGTDTDVDAEGSLTATPWPCRLFSQLTRAVTAETRRQHRRS